MSPAFPEGEAAPPSGELPELALASLAERDLGVYVHVPFCVRRCGYCDFNTYTPTELRASSGSVPASEGSERASSRPDLLATNDRADYVSAARAEIALAGRVLGASTPPISTIFFGGGTPSLLPASDLASLIGDIRQQWGLAPGAEITIEANPDSLSRESLERYAQAGVNRISLGMQSAVPHVLATLDRTHDPANVEQAVHWIKGLGMQVSLDLIYGVPGESLADWRASVQAALALQPDHLSAYALTIEPGTKMHGQVARGEIPEPTGDDEADKYQLVDELLHEARYSWYEISNWVAPTGSPSRHNQAYWAGHNWWGIGPGAHSHIGGVRWWNVKHPAAYADRLGRGVSPALARELLTPEQIHDERVLLGVRVAQGLPIVKAGRQPGQAAEPARIAQLIGDELIDPSAAFAGRILLTQRGRLLADTVVHTLLN